MGVDIDLVLAPVDGDDESQTAIDGSDGSQTAIECAVALADRYGADLHVLHVLDDRVARELEAGDRSAASVADHHRAFDSRVRERLPGGVGLSTSSAAGFSPARLSQTPGSVILDVAEELGADFLVVPREQPHLDSGVTLGRAALYVLEYASQPVLSV